MLSSSPAQEPQRSDHAAQHQRDLGFGALAAVFLFIIWALALLPGEFSRADVLTLGVLGLAAITVCWTPIFRHLEIQENAAMFVLTAAMFVIYSLARRVGPDDGWALTFSWLALPDDRFVIPYAARAAVLGAIVSSPAWWRSMQGWTRSLLAGASLLLLLAVTGFWLLARFYTVGPIEQLDPTPLPHLGMQLVEYSCLALLCNAAVAHPQIRRWSLRVLPILLLALWAKLQFFSATPLEANGAEGEGE